MIRSAIILLSTIWLSACASLSHQNGSEEEPPEIAHDLPLTEALTAALDHGDITLRKVVRLIGLRKQWPEAGDWVAEEVRQHFSDWSSVRLINAIQLYEATDHPEAAELFYTLSSSDRHLAQQLAWHLAAARPSRSMRQKIEERLTYAIDRNALKEVYWPEMADAVANNHLTSSYTVVRQALFENNHPRFALSLATLDPARASGDFMDYLALASLEELRQLSLNSIDVFTCMEIFRHFMKHPPSVNHPKFPHLFHYAISRNTALSDMAREVLSGFLPDQNGHLAQMLARMPNWVQSAFVEGSGRKMTPVLGLFLQEFRHTTSQQEVIREIDHVAR
ncbi:MAG: hypothetical protein H6618_00870 [Deltaproteobacteria bacterium]|nr:hypothetical protein [Deltaproteobacteria bacterium]